MADRLTRIYTRRGDDGTTGLASPTRLSKDAARIEAIGAVDELNAQLGVLLAEPLPEDVAALIGELQHRLFDLGGELAMPDYQAIQAQQVTALEEAIDRYNAALPSLKEFILPGGSRAAALCHVARTVCRRAERRLVSLNRDEPLAPSLLHFINRLSDLLFVLCRVLNRAAGRQDVYWQKRNKPGVA